MLEVMHCYHIYINIRLCSCETSIKLCVSYRSFNSIITMKLLAILLTSLVATAPMAANSHKVNELKDASSGDSESSGPIPACMSLPLASINYKNMMKWSPFHLMRASTNAFNCSQTIYVGPSANDNSYTGTGLVIQQGINFSFQHRLIGNSIFRSVMCFSGVHADYRLVHVKLRANSLSLCVVNCADDNIGYNVLFCIGRTSEDEEDIDDFLNSKLSGFPGIVDLQSGCPQPQYCDLFDH